MQLSRLFALRDFFSLSYYLYWRKWVSAMRRRSMALWLWYLIVVFPFSPDFWFTIDRKREPQEQRVSISWNLCRVGSFILGQRKRLIFIGVVRRQFALVWIDRHAHRGRWLEMVCDASSFKMHGEKFGEKKCICFSSPSKAFSFEPFLGFEVRNRAFLLVSASQRISFFCVVRSHSFDAQARPASRASTCWAATFHY